jgi:2-iminobutanoate/2-iminopropanoate deaminase
MKGLRLAVLALIALPALAIAQKTVVGTSTATLSPGVRVGDLLYLSGQLPGRDADSTIESQTKSALEKMNPVLAAAGTTKENIVKCTVFLIDVKDFQGMNRAYQQYFTKEPPARSTIVVAALVAPGKLEIECIAAVPPK